MLGYDHHLHDTRIGSGATTGGSGFLVVMAASGYGLTCLLNVVAARILPIAEYGALSAAIAMVGIICTFATLGLEKYALRVLPDFIVSRSHSQAKGYLIFGIIISLFLGTGCAVGSFFVYSQIHSNPIRCAAFEQMLWFVPAIALFMFTLEVATSFGSWVASTIVYRLVLPTAAVVAVASLAAFVPTPTLREAINAYGVVWLGALLVMAILAFRRAPGGVLQSRAEYSPKHWLSEGIGFLGFSLVVTIFNQGSIVVMELMKDDSAEVGMLSAVMQVAGFLIIAQTATARVYGPELSRLISAGDLVGQQFLMRSRAKFMLLLSGAFLVVIVVWGHELLGMFGEPYRHAYPALVVVTIGNCANAIFGFSPSVLQYYGEHKLTLTILCSGTLASLIAMSIVARSGTFFEVAWTYAITLSATYLVLQLFALHRLSVGARSVGGAVRSDAK